MINNKYPNISPSLNLDFTNSNTIDPRITFSRASAATYYDGKATVKAEENLLTYSQDYTVSSWAKTYSSITANSTVAPDGTTTASTLTDTATASDHAIGKTATTLVSVPYTVSTYLKQGTAQYIIVCLQGGALGVHWAAATVNMSTGVITQQSNGIGVTGVSTSIASTGNGWYRVTVTATSSSETAFSARVMFSDTATPTLQNYCYYPFTGTGANTVYLWGTQIEQRAYPTAYTPTTTQPITNYIPVLQTALSGVPRIDHDPVTGECKGLLIEEQRTNLLTYSEQFDNASWSKTNTSIISNAVISPDGTLTADKIVEAVLANDQYYIGKTLAATSGTAYTMSVYAKSGERSQIAFQSNISSGFTYGVFNLATGQVVNTPPGWVMGIYPVGNGWYRCSVTLTADASVNKTIVLQPATSGTVYYSGNGYSGIYIWGAQLEAGSFPTSYIKTEASQVTRAADSAQMTGANFSSWYRQGEGTLMAEARNIVGATVFSTAVLTDDQAIQTTNRLALFNRPDGVSGACALIAYSNSEQISNSFLFKEINKTSIAYKNNDVTAALNGSTSTQDILANIPAFTKLRIGQLTAGSDFFATQTIKRLTYYPKRLTDAQLQALTA